MLHCVTINPPLANSSHGTGKQLQYFAGLSGLECHHLCWDRSAASGDEVTDYTNLYFDLSSLVDWWPFSFGRGFLFRIQKRVGLKWWEAQRLSPVSRWRLRRLRSKGGKVAYVVVSTEESAAVARACLDILHVPYVLNWMDLEVREKLSPTVHVNIAALARGAAVNFALTTNLADSIGFSGKVCRIIRIGRPPAKERAVAPEIGRALRCVMIGSLIYPSLLQLWPEVIAHVRKSGLKVELYYIGSKKMFDLAPPALELKHLGVLTDEARDAALASMHMAFLTGPDDSPENDHLARYSFPSRVADYLAHGLPVAGTVHERSATADLLKPLLGISVWLSQRAEILGEAIIELSRNRERWELASKTGVEFARANFNCETIVGELAAALNAAANLENRG